MKIKFNLAWLALPLALLFAGGAFAQVTTDLELGYRWTSISGNNDLYRTQIDERPGLLIRSFSIYTPSTSPVSDFLRIDASDIGAGPSSSLRIETGREELYRFRLGWRSMDAFSALPAYANPLLGQGIIPGQHTWERDRTMFDADLELFPSAKITPFIGYSQFRNAGPGTTTYTLGGNDFKLSQDLEEVEREWRIGTGFNLGKVYGSVTQGWRNLDSDERLMLVGHGNNTNPVLGVVPGASGIIRESSLDADTPFTNIFINGDVLPNTKIIGNYSRFSSEADGTDDEVASGSFISFPLGSFFKGLNETVDSRAKNSTWRGSARVESSFGSKFDVMAGYRTEHRELTGSALINTLFLDAITFGGVNRGDVAEILNADSAIDRDVDVLEAAVAARNLGPFAFRVGYSISDYDISVDPDLEEIVVPGSQGGDFSRKVNTLDANASFTKALFSLGASIRFDDADRVVMRTDYTKRDRIRVRAGFHSPNNMVRLSFTGEDTSSENSLDGGGFNADGRQWTADAEVAPVDILHVRASYSILDADTSARIRRPETFAIETYTNEEDGEVLEGGLALFLAPVSFDLSLSRYINDGTLPFSVDRWRMRTVYDFRTHYGLAAEWSRDRYDEDFAYGQFDASRYGLFFRYRR